MIIRTTGPEEKVPTLTSGGYVRVAAFFETEMVSHCPVECPFLRLSSPREALLTTSWSTRPHPGNALYEGRCERDRHRKGESDRRRSCFFRLPSGTRSCCWSRVESFTIGSAGGSRPERATAAGKRNDDAIVVRCSHGARLSIPRVTLHADLVSIDIEIVGGIKVTPGRGRMACRRLQGSMFA
jgi:hypothetical protein